MSEALTLLNFLDRWADARPDRIAYRFLQSDESVGDEVSYAVLRDRTRTLARALASHAAPGSRALLLFETEPGFVDAFFACLAAGVLAVPADPPHGRRAWGGIDRIALDCRPSVVLTTRTLGLRWEGELARLSAEHGCAVLPIEDLLAAGAADAPNALPDIDPAGLAFLQYTSGSTSQPKGVMVTHANILANVRMIQEAFELDADTQTISWLPLFHDMGLIGFVLVPLYLGCTSTILSPAAFLEKPVRWLRAISRYRGTITSGPNFAYDLCLAKVRAEDREGLDLSSWACALNGSEPVSARTIARFREAYAPHGLSPSAFRPCYGMAEATLLISAVAPGSVARVLAAPPASDRALSEAAYRIESADIVSCGSARVDGAIRIVNPATLRECGAGETGEVWFQGSNVAAGYWRNPMATEAAFEARLADRPEAGAWLRTGDLGCIDEGELFLMGRMKELLIIRGRNFVPRDIEDAVAGSHPAIRAGHVIAVGLARDASQDLAIVAEIDREHWRTFDPRAVVDAILTAAHNEFALGVSSVTLLRPGGIPKTTSGKLKRLECARRLAGAPADAGGEWTVLHEWRLPEAADAQPRAGTTAPGPAVLDALSPDALTDVVLEWLRARLAQAVGCSPDQIADEEPFARFGLDSAVAVSLTVDLAAWLGVELSPTVFWEFAHPLALAEHLSALRAARAGAGDRVEFV